MTNLSRGSHSRWTPTLVTFLQNALRESEGGARQWSAFGKRLWRHLRYCAELVGVSLVVGVAGFMWICDQSLEDAILNTSMLLGGMGPIGAPDTWPLAGKYFASVFALYAGLVFVSVAALLLAPVFHHVLHLVHKEQVRAGEPSSLTGKELIFAGELPPDHPIYSTGYVIGSLASTIRPGGSVPPKLVRDESKDDQGGK